MEEDDTLERLEAGVQFGPRMFEEMTDLRLRAIAEIERLRARVREIDRSTAALGYLTRHVVEPLGPGMAPAADLMGVCVQAAEIAAGLAARAAAAESQRDALRKALEGIAEHVPGEDLRATARAALAAAG